jgi:photosystem II stability/assembly factor-like uncharacterized protein
MSRRRPIPAIAAPTLFILGWMMAAHAFAGQDRWTSSGPEGGYILALAVKPSEPATLYAAPYGGGIYRSRDAGESWKAVNAGLTDYGISSLAIDSADPSTIYAGGNYHGLFKSIDGGESWINKFRTAPVRSVIIDPANHLNLVLGTSGGVFASTDGGETWVDVSGSLPRNDQSVDVRDLAMDPMNSNRLYLASGFGLFTSDNRGGNWARVNFSPTLDRYANVIGVDPSNSQKLYVASDDFIFRSIDAGTTWTGTALRTYIHDLIIDPTGTAYAATATGIFQTDDSGATWRLLPALNGSEIETLALDPGNRATVYAGTGGPGVFRSNDGARNWSAKNSGLTAGNTRAVASDASNPLLIYAATHSGVFKSVNGGSEWIPSDAQLRDSTTVAIDPNTPSTVYAASDGSAKKTTDSGETWTKIQLSGAKKLAIDPSNPSTVYAVLADGISKSINGGASWTSINNGLTLSYYGGFYALSIAVDPVTPSTLYAGSGGMLKSIDSGATWKSVNEGLLSDGGIVTPQALAIDPSRPSIVYAATWYGLFRTVDGAQHWSRMEGFGSQTVADVAIDPSDPSTVYAATYPGILRSTDRGLSWTPFNTGLSAGLPNSISIDSTGKFLVAGTTGGVFTFEVVSKLPRELGTEGLPGDPSRLPRLLDQLQRQGNAGSGFVIVATGNVSGVGGARFRSDVSLVNSAPTNQDVMVAWLAAGADGTDARAFRLTLPASKTTTIAGFIDNLGLSGLGCLVVIAIDANGNVDSRASIDGSSRIWMTGSNNPGAVSQSIPGTPIKYLGNRTTLSAAGLRSDSDFRTNIGVVNLDTRSRTFAVDLIGERHSAKVSVDVPPVSMRQIAVPTGDYGTMSATFTTSSSDFTWTAYGSSVNNFTGEGSVVAGK